ncbi:alpha/beta hydrolase [Mesoterricola sediminis]|uniref:Alpha/beta hydrolase n=1 Tax=Mesoterricola sediminis TaxID=2927980 RepID=A0AA48GQ06_9BACT|nr:alpha/beta hydrolase [Mesoterricola sediminis]
MPPVIPVPSLPSETFALQACGRRLRARRLLPPEARPDAPTLVFLHEALGSVTQWRDFPDALAGALGWPALVYDRYGHGGAEPRTRPQTRADFDAEPEVALPAVLDACGIARPVLVGHSDGGTFALRFAARFPDRPLGVLTLAAHVFVEEVTRTGVATALKAYREGGLRRGLARHHGAGLDAMFEGWAGLWLSEAHRGWSIVEEQRAVRAPVLALQGAADPYGTPAQVAAIAAATGGRGTLLPACAHAPHLEARTAVLAEALPFLRALGP